MIKNYFIYDPIEPLLSIKNKVLKYFIIIAQEDPSLQGGDELSMVKKQVNRHTLSLFLSLEKER